jgi:hypothetical protein
MYFIGLIVKSGGGALLLAHFSFLHFYLPSDDGRIERPKHVVAK